VSKNSRWYSTLSPLNNSKTNLKTRLKLSSFQKLSAKRLD